MLPFGWKQGPCRMLELNGVWGSIEFSPFIWQMRKLRPQEGKGRVQGHVVNPVFFGSWLPCQERRRPIDLGFDLEEMERLGP